MKHTITGKPVKRKVVEQARFFDGADEQGRRLLLIRHGGIDYFYLASVIIGPLGGHEGPEILGFKLEKSDGTEYCIDITANPHTCECLGHLRWGHCRHVNGLKMAIHGAPEVVGYCHGASQEAPF